MKWMAGDKTLINIDDNKMCVFNAKSSNIYVFILDYSECLQKFSSKLI